ncbi:uncharacterized protein LOC130438800 isoform X2 [Triplophysa dalaica]|uniref:uncharacterized protein LOC130438800 isoform X2 n=1 Tax=Triplophysa dalaica TaxID=1582913 RepID=UPI0024DFDB61|nr:uncharacterized protein LOC130438800 isoform X2 [Triplophysa dalaica]XP_056626964.1 uncharacterized protein LOC130438800 isoform X2 [Triplophysa dalaica]
MGGVGVDLLLLLVLIFRASCIEDVGGSGRIQGDPTKETSVLTDFSFVACKGVTEHLGGEITLKCTVIYSNRCHAVMYKFINKDRNTTICRERFTSKSTQKHFSCSYTPNEDMTSTFLFFLQADCGIVKKYFTVNTAGGSGRIQADPTKETSVLTDFSLVACKGVTGHLGGEITLKCTVIYSNRCHAVMYKFINKDRNTTICPERLTSKSTQKHFSCSYAPNEDMTSTFLFFLQADCGIVKKYFTVNTAGGSGRIQADPTKETSVLTGKPGIAIIMAGISCFIIFVVGFVLVRKHNTKNSFGFLKNYVVLDDKIKTPDKETM